jgi:glycosyltransferase involved in cell wall biosynthesis
MKVALVGRYGEGEILTGPERVARELYGELKNKNHHVVFLEYFFSGYEGASLFKKLLGKEYSYNNSIVKLGIIHLLLFLTKNKFDIIHIVNSQRFILFPLLLRFLHSGKILTTFHGFMIYELPQKNYRLKRYFADKWIEKLLVKKSRLLIFPSSLLLNTFRQFYKVSDDKCIIIPNGISKIFCEQERVFPEINNSLKIIFYNGFNDSINRGLNNLLEVMNNVECEVELYVIGNKIGIKPQKKIKVNFVELMTQANLINFLMDKQFILKSNSYDTFPIMVAECMALGLIPIISENIGIKDLIEHGRNGFIYNSSKEGDLALLLNQISDREFNLAMISENAKKTVMELSWEKITEQYISAYKTAL